MWKLEGDLDWGMGARADTDKTEIVLNAEKQGKMRTSLINWKTYVTKSLLNFPMNYIGWSNLALIALALTVFGRQKSLTGALHAAPLLCYNFGTALLLTGFDWRFFYLTFPLIIPTVFLLIKDTQPHCEKAEGQARGTEPELKNQSRSAGREAGTKSQSRSAGTEAE